MRLPPCDVIDVPDADSQWIDVPEIYTEAVQALDRCNQKITAFWTWYESQK